MLSCLNHMYNFLKNVDTFDNNVYNKFISIYGRDDVDNTICFMLSGCKSRYMGVCTKFIECSEDDDTIDNFVNVVLIRRLHEIIGELNLIFSDLGFMNSEFNNLYIIDKANYVLSRCFNDKRHSRIKILSQQFIMIRKKVMLCNDKLVINEVISQYGECLDEVLINGRIGLLTSIETFDYDKEIKFSNYANTIIHDFIVNKKNDIDNNKMIRKRKK